MASTVEINQPQHHQSPHPGGDKTFPTHSAPSFPANQKPKAPKGIPIPRIASHIRPPTRSELKSPRMKAPALMALNQSAAYLSLAGRLKIVNLNMTCWEQIELPDLGSVLQEKRRWAATRSPYRGDKEIEVWNE